MDRQGWICGGGDPLAPDGPRRARAGRGVWLVDKAFLDQYDIQQAGGQTILEYWIPAEDLEAFNRHIVGLIEVVREFR